MAIPNHRKDFRENVLDFIAIPPVFYDMHSKRRREFSFKRTNEIFAGKKFTKKHNSGKHARAVSRA
jgi:hypothetical protein